ncbi:hypothetical protein AB0F15_34070 [Amycolatopsis sp. NPDC026612]|uniref:hypothetical protein n=1 Tax=Amycolatopsis sp. NPDC026612 TaxID=3155466 RepID=UPI0033CC5BC5
MTVAALALAGLFVGYIADITAAVAAIGLIGLTALPFLALGIVLIRHEWKKPSPQRSRYKVAGCAVLVLLALAAVAPRLWSVSTQNPAAAAAPAARPRHRSPPTPPRRSRPVAPPCL